MSAGAPPGRALRPAGPVPVFINRRAGLGRSDASEPAASALRDSGVAAVVRPLPPEQIPDEVYRASLRGEPLVAVGGGDGTLRASAEALLGTGTALLPFPTGTLNHFARRLELTDLQASARAAARGHDIRVPAGVMDDLIFLNTATFGLYAEVVQQRERLRPLLGKWGGASVALGRAIARLRTFTITLRTPAGEITRETPLLWVGLGWGSFPLVHESPDDRRLPELEIVVLRPGGRLRALSLMLRFALTLRDRERLRNDPELEFLHARELIIQARRPIGVTLDGEPMRRVSPIFVSVQEEAVLVRAPGDFR